jgi:hypothetical protein
MKPNFYPCTSFVLHQRTLNPKNYILSLVESVGTKPSALRA